MSILIDSKTLLLVQGITGHEGLFHTRHMLDYGTNVVAGVTPGKGGEWVLEGKIPVFDTARIACEVTGANTSIIFVPPRNAADAILEAADAGIRLIFCITEGVPVADMTRVLAIIKQKNVRLIGPNCPGAISPGEAKVGIIPGSIALPGNIGVVSRSGTLTYEVLNALNQNDLGVSTCVGIGGDALIGSTYSEILEMFEEDPHTDQVVLIGEIGGTGEEDAADLILRMTKPVVAFVAGRSAPAGRRMGHAGAIIEGGKGSAESKIQALEAIGVRVAHHPEQIPECLIR